MALARTTLAAAITKDDLTLRVSSATGISAGMWARVNDEFIREVLSIDGTTVKIGGRGDHGTAGVAHNILSPITFGTRSGTSPDSANLQVKAGTTVPQPPAEETIVTYGADGAITVPIHDQLILLSKATAGAFTLAAPRTSEDGPTLTITTTTAAAHVITATGLLEDGVTGGAKNTATFAAFAGASCVLKAINGKWYTIALKAVTVA